MYMFPSGTLENALPFNLKKSALSDALKVCLFFFDLLSFLFLFEKMFERCSLARPLSGLAGLEVCVCVCLLLNLTSVFFLMTLL